MEIFISRLYSTDQRLIVLLLRLDQNLSYFVPEKQPHVRTELFETQQVLAIPYMVG